MKKVTLVIIGLIVGVFCMSTYSDAKNKYDIILKSKSHDKIVNFYDNEIKNNSIRTDYFNLIFDSPNSMIQILKNNNCDEEVFEFIKNNKIFVFKLSRFGLMWMFRNTKSTNGTLLYVTNFIRSDKYMVATNAQEVGTEVMMMRQFPSFILYEGYSNGENLTEFISDCIVNLYKNELKEG